MFYIVYLKIYESKNPQTLPLLYCFNDEKGTVDASVRD